MPTPEGEVSKEIQDGLRKLGWRVIRMQSGQVRVRGAFMHLCPKGTPDLMCFDQDGELLWVEVKAALGKPKPEQLEFAQWALSVSHRYVLARSLMHVLDYLAN